MASGKKQYVSEIAMRLPVDDHVVMPKTLDDSGEVVSVTGYIPRDYEAQPLGSGRGAVLAHEAILRAYPDEKVWRERFKELEAKKMDLVSVLTRAFAAKRWYGLNQDPTNYCWGYGPTHAYMIQRLLAGEPFHRMSPYSVCAIIKNYQNNGGWGSQFLAQMIQSGIATEEHWPMERPGMSRSERQAANMNAIRNGRQYLAGSRANAALHKCLEYDDLPARSWPHKMAYACVPLPIASGYNKIGHERCTVGGVILSSGELAAADLDSYTGDGSPDIKIYTERSLGAGEDMVVPRITSASDK